MDFTNNKLNSKQLSKIISYEPRMKTWYGIAKDSDILYQGAIDPEVINNCQVLTELGLTECLKFLLSELASQIPLFDGIIIRYNNTIKVTFRNSVPSQMGCLIVINFTDAWIKQYLFKDVQIK